MKKTVLIVIGVVVAVLVVVLMLPQDASANGKKKGSKGSTDADQKAAADAQAAADNAKLKVLSAEKAAMIAKANAKLVEINKLIESKEWWLNHWQQQRAAADPNKYLHKYIIYKADQEIKNIESSLADLYLQRKQQQEIINS